MFVQINDRAFNPDLITQIWFTEEAKSVTLYLTTLGNLTIPTMTFTGLEYEAFESWWHHKADVYTVSVPEEN